MSTAENSHGVVPIRYRWWSVIKNAWANVASVSILIAVGVYMFARHWGLGDPQYLLESIYTSCPDFLRMGCPPLLTPDMTQALVFDPVRKALVSDQWVILGRVAP
jgi:hypothetical protein